MASRGPRILGRSHGSWTIPNDDARHDDDGPGAIETVPPDPTMLSELQLEVALYIENISSELRLMAKAADLEALSYFLEMARIEASIQIERRALAKPVAR